jgi:hypothetical protein
MSHARRDAGDAFEELGGTGGEPYPSLEVERDSLVA